MRSILNMLIVMVLSLAAPVVVEAHPHSWIDLSVRLEVDDKGRLQALEQAWRLDPFYSLVLLEDLAAEPDGMNVALDRLRGDMLRTLAPQGFFTEAEVDGQALSFKGVTEATVMNSNDRIVLHFRLPLRKPITLAGHRLSYRVYDPTYYIEVVHEAEDDGSTPLPNALVVPDRLNCEHEIVKANPDPEKVAEASRLDIDETGDPRLGRFFAETGRVDCR
uniref:DUF1007 family protein n=1 Tax=Halomonas sp. TaxID=1486246 RepID=UPI00261D3147|nr:DUF1007 family protein [Halomonas sp.]